MKNNRQMRLTISFSRDNEDLYDLLKAIPNRSDYVCRVLRNAQRKDLNIEEVLKQVIDYCSAGKASPLANSRNEKDFTGLLKSAADSFDF